MREEGRGSRNEVWGRKVEGARGEGGRKRDKGEGMRPRGLGGGVRKERRGSRYEVWGRRVEGAGGEGEG